MAEINLAHTHKIPETRHSRFRSCSHLIDWHHSTPEAAHGGKERACGPCRWLIKDIREQLDPMGGKIQLNTLYATKLASQENGSFGLLPQKEPDSLFVRMQTVLR